MALNAAKNRNKILQQEVNEYNNSVTLQTREHIGNKVKMAT